MKNALFIIFVSTLLVLVQGGFDEDRVNFQRVHQECQTDPTLFVDDKIVKGVALGEKKPLGVFGAHAFCMAKKLNLQEDNGDINRDNLKKFLGGVIEDQVELEKFTDKCYAQKDTADLTALALFQCVHEVTLPVRRLQKQQQVIKEAQQIHK